MQKTKIFFIISFLILGVCTFFCAPNIIEKFSQMSVLQEVSNIINVNPITEDLIVNVDNISNFSIAGISKKLFTILVFTIVVFFILVSAIILKIRSLISLASGTEKEIDDAISQLSNMQNKIKNDLSFYTHFIQKQESSEKIQETSNDKVEKTVGTPVTKKYIQKEKKYVNDISEPILISQKPLSKTKGFYLVDCGSEKALIGYIKDEIFVLNKFQDSANDNIHVRFTERIGNRLIYLVKNGRYKALVQVEKENMKVLLEM